jgi:hypothetical protein
MVALFIAPGVKPFVVSAVDMALPELVFRALDNPGNVIVGTVSGTLGRCVVLIPYQGKVNVLYDALMTELLERQIQVHLGRYGYVSLEDTGMDTPIIRDVGRAVTVEGLFLCQHKTYLTIISFTNT